MNSAAILEYVAGIERRSGQPNSTPLEEPFPPKEPSAQLGPVPQTSVSLPPASSDKDTGSSGPASTFRLIISDYRPTDSGLLPPAAPATVVPLDAMSVDVPSTSDNQQAQTSPSIPSVELSTMIELEEQNSQMDCESPMSPLTDASVIDPDDGSPDEMSLDDAEIVGNNIVIPIEDEINGRIEGGEEESIKDFTVERITHHASPFTFLLTFAY